MPSLCTSAFCSSSMNIDEIVGNVLAAAHPRLRERCTVHRRDDLVSDEFELGKFWHLLFSSLSSHAAEKSARTRKNFRACGAQPVSKSPPASQPVSNIS